MRASLIFAAMLSGLLLASASHAEESVTGIGVALGLENQALKIMKVFPDTPAAKAGLTAGLLVDQIDGTPTHDKLLRNCVDMLRGAVGTKVQLQLIDTAMSRTNTVELTRAAIPIPGAEAPAAPSRPPIYDENRAGGEQIVEALAAAKKDSKRVLLDFGANWCGWCHKLHKLCHTDPDIAATIKESYIVVMVDVNKNHNEDINQRYGNPRRFGIPALVILDAEGKALTTKDSGELEDGDHHDPKRVLAFLNQWAYKK